MVFFRALNSWVFLLLIFSGFVHAETTVEDESSPASSTSPSEQRFEQQARNQADLLKQINTLNQQIKDLQGQLEIHEHDIKVLNDQQKTQYNDLDERLTELSHLKTAHTEVTTKKTLKDDTESTEEKSKKTTTISHEPSSNEEEQKAYRTAYGLLKNKRYDKAKTAFQKFLQDYPSSTNAIDAHYWLGNVYLLKNQPAKAITEFKAVLKMDTTHSKSADTLLKMGLAYSVQGNTKQAHTYFKNVKKTYPNSQAAKIASEQLRGS